MATLPVMFMTMSPPSIVICAVRLGSAIGEAAPAAKSTVAWTDERGRLFR
jgi:hypothetical protein